MNFSPSSTKLLFALSLLPLLLLLAATGGDRWDGYWIVITLLIAGAAVCLGSAFPRSGGRYFIGIAYFVLLEIAVAFLP